MRVFLTFMAVSAVLLASGCADFKRYRTGSYQKGFSPHLYDYGDSFPASFKGKEWNPTAWPLSYQDKNKFTQNLFDSDIIRDQYIKGDAVPVVVVGPNFYHLSDLDQYRLCKSLDMLYGATTGKYGHFLLQDWYSKEIIGAYTKNGLDLR